MILHVLTESAISDMGDDEIREEGLSRILLSESQIFFKKDPLRHILSYSLARDNRFLESGVFLKPKYVHKFLDMLEKEVLDKFPIAKVDFSQFENSYYNDFFVEIRKIAINLLSKIN